MKAVNLILRGGDGGGGTKPTNPEPTDPAPVPN